MTYDAQSYKNWRGTPAPSYDPGRVTFGSWGGNPAGSTGSSDQSNSSFFLKNYMDPTKPSAAYTHAAFASGIPGLGEYNMYRGMSKLKDARKQDRERQANFSAMHADAASRSPSDWLNAIDPTSGAAQEARRRIAQGQAMSQDEVMAAVRQEDQGKQRAGYDKSIDEYFGSADRAGWQQSIISNQLNDDLANVSQAYKENTRSAALGAAARGTMNGSVDIENRSAIARNRDAGAISAAANADASKAGFQEQDRNSRQQLHGLVQSQDIGSSDQLRNALEGLRSTTNAQGAQYNAQRQQQQINNFGAQQQSQAWGGGLNALANGVKSWNASPTASHGGW
jgi:hypothetical protein